jgi:hypothetical protein
MEGPALSFSVLEWLAPAATMIAAVLTACNLGPRVTGWGFAVFVIGSLSWVAIAIASHQPNLLWTNGFLTIVNIAGVWRWLGRRAQYEKGAKRAATSSAAEATPTLTAATRLVGVGLAGPDGSNLGQVVDAMVQCDDGRLAYLVVKRGGVGGIGETLHALPMQDVVLTADEVTTEWDAATLDASPALPEDAWPSTLSTVRGPADR